MCIGVKKLKYNFGELERWDALINANESPEISF